MKYKVEANENGQILNEELTIPELKVKLPGLFLIIQSIVQQKDDTMELTLPSQNTRIKIVNLGE